jgi:hypothetical protein
MRNSFLLFTILVVFSWCNLFAQQKGLVTTEAEVSPYQNSPSVTVEDAMWDVLLDFDASALTGASGNAGCEWDGTNFYSTRWASNLLHKYDATGTTMLEEFSIPGVTGLRDLAFDGTYMYGGAAANTIYQMDFVTKTLIGTIPSPVAVRFIAYDEGADAFWVGNWTDPPTLVSRTGTTLASFTTGFAAQYGAAYDNVSPGGPFLWIFNQENTAGGIPQTISQWDIATGTATGVTHDVMTDVGIAAGNLSIAGGLFSMTDYVSGYFTIGGLLQGNPNGDRIFVYEVAPAGGGGIFTDNFDSYVAGQQLACQNPTEWTTWSNLPCDATEDSYISDNYSYSGSNSNLIVQNNDVVKPLGNLTSGKWYMSMLVYIPAGKSGYFNQLTGFTPDPYEWGMDCYFDVGGTGRVDTTGGGGATFNVPFNWVQDAWNQVVLIVDLDAPGTPAEFWIGTNPANLTMITTWDWTQGGTKATRIAADDFFGAAATDEMYMDNYYFGDAMPPIIPVELTSFAASVTNLGQVMLNWETATEINNQGFEIERRTESSEYRTVGFVEGYGTTTEQRSYSYLDQTVEQGVNFYRLKQVDFDGSFSYSDEIEVDVTGPLTFNLDQNYPNPFNPSTNINFSIPESGNVRLAVYNLVGEEVAILVDGFTHAGFYEATFDASNLPSGIYLYKLQSANSVQTKKMMLLK